MLLQSPLLTVSTSCPDKEPSPSSTHHRHPCHPRSTQTGEQTTATPALHGHTIIVRNGTTPYSFGTTASLQDIRQTSPYEKLSNKTFAPGNAAL